MGTLRVVDLLGRVALVHLSQLVGRGSLQVLWPLR